MLGNHIRPTDGVYGAVLYGMTGLHALHVISGVIGILLVWNLGRKGHFSAERHWGVEATAIYWHYVDLVWVFFYPALYLIGDGGGGTAGIEGSRSSDKSLVTCRCQTGDQQSTTRHFRP